MKKKPTRPLVRRTYETRRYPVAAVQYNTPKDLPRLRRLIDESARLGYEVCRSLKPSKGPGLPVIHDTAVKGQGRLVGHLYPGDWLVLDSNPLFAENGVRILYDDKFKLLYCPKSKGAIG